MSRQLPDSSVYADLFNDGVHGSGPHVTLHRANLFIIEIVAQVSIISEGSWIMNTVQKYALDYVFQAQLSC